MIQKLLILISLFILAACGGGQGNPPAGQEKGPAVIEVYRDTTDILAAAIAASLGAKKVEYLKADTVFLIDGDGTLHREDAVLRFRHLLDTGRAGAAQGTTQMFGYYPVAQKYRHVKLYCKSVPEEWARALDSAVDNSRRAGHGIQYSVLSTATGATTVVSTVYNTSSTIATAAYPSYYGYPGNTIRINTYHNGLSFTRKVYALTHELGHTIGFAHTDGTYGQIVDGSIKSDSSSVMNSTVREWRQWGDYDVRALNRVYPPVQQ